MTTQTEDEMTEEEAEFNLDFVRRRGRADNKISEIIHNIKSTKLNNKSLKTLHADAVNRINEKEKYTQSFLTLRQSKMLEFEKMKKVKVDSDTRGVWQDLLKTIDDIFTYDEMLLIANWSSAEVDKVLREKMFSELTEGYDKGWHKKVNDDVKGEILTMGARLDELSEYAGINPKERLIEKEKMVAKDEEKLRKATLTDEEKKREYFVEQLDKEARKQGGGPFTARQVRDLISGDIIEIDAAVKELVKQGRWTFEKKGVKHQYRCVVLEEKGNLCYQDTASHEGESRVGKAVLEPTQVYNEKRGSEIEKDGGEENVG